MGHHLPTKKSLSQRWNESGTLPAVELSWKTSQLDFLTTQTSKPCGSEAGTAVNCRLYDNRETAAFLVLSYLSLYFLTQTHFLAFLCYSQMRRRKGLHLRCLHMQECPLEHGAAQSSGGNGEDLDIFTYFPRKDPNLSKHEQVNMPSKLLSFSYLHFNSTYC